MKTFLIVFLFLFSISSFKAQAVNSDYTVNLTFPANYKVGDYIEFLKVVPDMASSSGYYEISIAYTRVDIAAAATHIASITHDNPSIWRECGRINTNDYLNYGNRSFTIDANTAFLASRFRIRATAVSGDPNHVMKVVVKIRSIGINSSWVALNNTGNDTSVNKYHPMTQEWDLLVGNPASLNGAIMGIKVLQNGNVGIGNSSPVSKLDLGTNYSDPSSFPNKITLWSGGANNYSGFGTSNGSLDYFSQGQHRFFVNYNGSPGIEVFTLKASGNAALQGKLEAKELKVTTTPTADFVFNEDYQLPSLQYIEEHIKEKKHLPEIPSAQQMEKEGVNVGDFQIKLLQKIEELTLYIIELNKQVEKLKSENSELKK